LGQWTWQIKATRRPPTPARELGKEDVRKDIEVGRNYVMVWTQDHPSREELAKELRDGVAAINSASDGLLLAAEQLERLARVHPAVVQALGGPPLIGLTMNQWGRYLEQNLYPFAVDDARERQLQMVREFAQASLARPSHLHVFGDTGVGKSRLVLEALSVEGLSERGVAALDYQQVEQGRLGALVSSEESHVVIVVDDTTWDDARRLEGFAGAAGGRIRLITIGDRPSRDMVADSTSVDVSPLSEGVVAQLVQRVVGLDSQQAELVAELAEGFPKLAIEIAKAVLAAAPSATVVDLLRSANIAQLLVEMLPDGSTREDLSLLSLVDRIGYESEVSFETDQLCSAFGPFPMASPAQYSRSNVLEIRPIGLCPSPVPWM
jgi:hypothetical protein